MPALLRYGLLILLVVFSARAGVCADFVAVKLINPQDEVTLTLEVAESRSAREKGLMDRRALGTDEGMLFIYPHERMLSFWMKNTFLPLDIMFFSSSGEWINTVEKAEPLTLSSRRSSAPARFVVEMIGGSAERLGIGEGSALFIEDCSNLKTRLDFAVCSR